MNRKQLVVAWVIILLLCGCSTTEKLIMGTDYTNYKQRMQEIEKSYQNKEITKAEYLDLKIKNEQLYQRGKEK